MRVVLDTNVLVSAALTPGGPAHQVIQMAFRGDLQLCVNTRMVAEYREVLTRGRFSLSPGWVDGFLEALLVESQEVLTGPVEGRFPDETDRPFVEAAVAGRVEVLITGNVKHLQVAKKYGISVQTPVEFLSSWWRNR